MTLTRAFGCALLVPLSLLSAGCGSDAPADPSSQNPTIGTGPLLPWKVGNKWTYRVSDGTEISEKTTTVDAEELVGGTGPNANVMAYRVVTRKGTMLNDETESWQGPAPDSADKIIRYREIAYSAKTGSPSLETHWAPYKLHIDGRAETLVADYTWREDYEETKTPFDGTPVEVVTEADRWTIISLDESVTVAGTRYDHAVHFQKFSNSAKEYWYLRGVGKLKETGSQTEELVSYSLAH
ncbi:MAG: hypothetical protein ACOY0T_12505 [Myxococcota bacterium]